MPSLPSGYEGKLRELRELKLVFESKSEYWDDQGKFLFASWIPLMGKISYLLLCRSIHPFSDLHQFARPGHDRETALDSIF